MKLTECKLCERDLEHTEYGRPEWDSDIAPYSFPICYDCLKYLKKELAKLN